MSTSAWMLDNRAIVAERVAEYHTGYPMPFECRDTRHVRGLACWLLRSTGASWPEIGEQYGISHSTAMIAAGHWVGEDASDKALEDYKQRLGEWRV